MSKKDGSGPDEINWCTVFPFNKIKQATRTEDAIISEKSLYLLSACSALFMRDLLQKASSSDNDIITLQNVQSAVRGTFCEQAILEETRDQVDDGKLLVTTVQKDNDSSKTKPKATANRKRPPPEANTLPESEIPSVARKRQAIQVDDDDYD